jgi:hypothetical protein
MIDWSKQSNGRTHGQTDHPLDQRRKDTIEKMLLLDTLNAKKKGWELR